VVRISKLLKTWLGGKVLAWDDLSVSQAGQSGEWQGGDGEEREWQAAREAAEEREWQAAREAAEEREWQAARQAAEEREWRALIAGAHQKSAAAAVMVTRKTAVPPVAVEGDEEEWSTLLARAKTAVVVRPSPKPAARDRWQTVFGKPRPGTGASAH
jgi:hypothetical protein